MAQNLSHARDPRADNPQFRRRFPARCDSRRLEKGKKMGERKLTPRQERFAKEYLVDLNATQAAIRAGYSAKTANRIGPELLGKTCVAAAIARQKEKRAAKIELTAEKVLEMNLRFYKVNSELIPKETFGEQATTKDGALAWRMVDAAAAAKALDMLNKHFGWYEKPDGSKDAAISSLASTLQGLVNGLRPDNK